MKTVTGWTMVFISAGLVALGGLAYWHWTAPSRSLQPYAGPLEKITISTSADAKSALLFIAQDKGYFADQGLEVALKIFPSGKMGCEQLKAGNIDIANISCFVLVDQVFAGTRFLRCLGAIAAADDHQIITRKGLGIPPPGDLCGKRIGAPPGTMAEFFLGRFLTFNNLGLRHIKYIPVEAADQEDALATGRVDAVVVWEQWAYKIKKRLGDKVVSWPAQSGQKYYWLLVTADAWAKTRPDVLQRVFKALDQAEKFLKSHKEESIEIIARRINLDPDNIKDSLNRSTYALSLDQGLLIMMEDEARWMIKNKRTGQTRVPNYLDYIHAEALATVNPQAVSIIIAKNQK